MRKEAIKWETAEGIPVLKVWELNGDDVFPQTILLRVTNDAYRRFFNNPKGFMNFLNAHKIFSKDVIVAGPWVTLSSVEQQPEPREWILTVGHGHSSTIFVAALPQLETAK